MTGESNDPEWVEQDARASSAGLPGPYEQLMAEKARSERLAAALEKATHDLDNPDLEKVKNERRMGDLRKEVQDLRAMLGDLIVVVKQLTSDRFQL
jgi:hypothetical protein